MESSNITERASLSHTRSSSCDSLLNFESMQSAEGLLEKQNRKNEKPKQKTWRNLFNFAERGHVLLLVIATLSSILSGVIDPVSAIFLGRIFQAFTDFGANAITAANLQADVKQNALALVGVGTAIWLFNALFLILWVLVGELQAKSARSKIFDSLMKKSAEFYDTREEGIGSMTPRLQTYIRELQLATSQPIGYIFSSLASATASTSIALKYEWSLTLILLSPMPVTAFVLSLISSRMQNDIKNQVEKLATAAKNTTNAFMAVETVKCFNGQDVEFNRYCKAITSAASHYMRQVYGNALEIGYMKCVTLLTFMIGFWYGSHLVVTGQKTTADVITTFFSCLEVANAIQAILPQMIVIEKGIFAGHILNSLLHNKQQEVIQDKGGIKPTQSNGYIEFKNVSFAYPSRRNRLVLREVSCCFRPDNITIILGESGCGKSTLAQLLLRFYEPTSGQIYLDGTLLSDLDIGWLRDHITLVEQQSILFEGTIMENIQAGCNNLESISFQDILEAAKFALLSDITHELVHGLSTKAGINGQGISGGQRQRVTIARARLRDASILILDESTSALDRISRSLIVAAIRQWRRCKLTIFITHDVSVIENRDLLYLFKEGRVVDSCTYSSSDAMSSSPISLYLSKDANCEGITATLPSTREGLPQRECKHYEHNPGYKRMDFTVQPRIVGIQDQDDVNYCQTVSAFTDNIAAPTDLLSDFEDGILTRNSLSFEDQPASSESRSRGHVESSTDANHIELDNLTMAGSGTTWGKKDTIDSAHIASQEQKPIIYANSISEISKSVENSDSANSRWYAQRPISLRQILITIWPNLHSGARKILIGAFLCTLIHSISVPIFSWAFSNLVSTFYAKENAAQEALKWSLTILGLVFIDGPACFGMHVSFEYCGQLWVDRIRLRAMKMILNQPMKFFAEDAHSPSQLAYSLDRNAEEMRNILGRIVAFGSVAIVLMITAITWSLVVCWQLTLAALALTPIALGLTSMFQNISEKLENHSNNAGESAGAILNEALLNIKTVWALTLESKFRTKHNAAVHRAFVVGTKRALVCGFFFGISQAILVFNYALMFYIGSVLAASKAYTVQDILLVFSQLIFALTNVTIIVSIIPQLSSSKDTAIRLLSLAYLPQVSHEDEGNLRPDLIGEIRFSNVSFGYHGSLEKIVLSNISVAFPEGAITALVGTSGSGKSTLVSLLLKLHQIHQANDPFTSGITVGGRDIRQLATPVLRGIIAVVPQRPVLFASTAMDNIAYGLNQNSRHNNLQAVRAAAVAAGIDEFLSTLPDGYDTLIGDGGLGLSSGQIQRLAIARALVRKPAVLIFDEATSALDGANASHIRDSIGRFVSENPTTTVIMITHSKDMMLFSDRIVVLDDGRVAEEGTYEELMNNSGMFAKLWSGGDQCFE